MRIQQIRFKNLNSLVGEWEIDLMHPAFVAEGIFAITGPTGAGKTTILDAICLALYGRTPRLNRVSKSVNEIMSRQTGECFAEVTFATQTGRFRCHWSQHRARRKPDGELQAPRHEIAQADTGEIFEVKLRGVADHIVAVTGMDFERFTRSMLLAQGGFAAFLQAAPDERAPILEQITGTEIYSEISVRVHERRAEEQKKLDLLKAELDELAVLSPEAEQGLVAERDHKEKLEQELEQTLTQDLQAIAWLEGIAALEVESKRLMQREQGWRTRMASFEEQRLKLDGARRALELSGHYATLQINRQNQETERLALTESTQALPQRQAALEVAQRDQQAAAEYLAQKKADNDRMLPILRKAREIDLNIAAKTETLQALQDAISVLTKTLEQRRLNHRENVALLAANETKLTNLHERLYANSADAKLVQELAGLQRRIETLQGLQSRHDAVQAEQEQAVQRMERARQHWHAETEKLAVVRQEHDAIRPALLAKQTALADLLGAETLVDWRGRQRELQARKDELAAVCRGVQERRAAKRTLAALSTEKEALGIDAVGVAGHMQSQAQKRVGLEREIGVLEENLLLHEKIGSYEQERAQLQDGQPCPLCGATDHPHATANVPAPDHTRSRLNEAKSRLKSLYEANSDLRIRHATLGQDLALLISKEKEQIRRIELAGHQINLFWPQLLPALVKPGSAADIDEQLMALDATTARALISVNQIVREGELVEQALTILRSSESSGKDKIVAAEKTVQEAAYEYKLATRDHERLVSYAGEIATQRTALLEVLRQVLSDYDIAPFAIADLAGILSSLVKRRDRWTAWNDERVQYEREIAALSIQGRHQAEEITRHEAELLSQQNQFAAVHSERTRLADQRSAVFAGELPDAEEARLAQLINDAEQRHEQARRKSETEKSLLQQVQSRIHEIGKTLESRAITLQTAHEVFALQLERFGFADEEAFRAACLEEDERKQLAIQARQLDEERAQLTAALHETTRLLESEREKRTTQQPLDEHRSRLETLKLNLKTLQQEMGAITHRIRENENRKQQQAGRLTAVRAQERESQKWEQLHALIGSSDGKKYRNFAQGLTFELMVGHANRQLYKMTDRYLLLRDAEQPLELNVMDNYQAGEIRSTKNLSGGEGFIVSLALALGLSQMSSENVRVDSLFLDEGFGTLDEDALDTALETLAGLQQDGKLIGVISHVPALKERISTQVHVVPETGGRSRLVGPGCRKLSGAHA